MDTETSEDIYVSLYTAAVNGDVDIITALSELPGVDLNKKYPNGKTLLHVGVENQQDKVVGLLACLPNINVNVTDGENCTPLFCAIEKGYHDLCDLLLQNPSLDPNIRCKFRATALLEAADSGNADVITALGKSSKLDANARIHTGATAMMLCAIHGHTEAMQELLKIPTSDVNMPDNRGATPLFVAAMLDHHSIVKMLAEFPGTDPNVLTIDGSAAIHFPAQQGREDIIDCLLKMPTININIQKISDGASALHLATNKSHLNVVIRLLATQNIDVNSRMKNGEVPIYRAVGQDNVDIVRAIAQMPDINPNIKETSMGDSALAFCAQEGHLRYIKILTGIRHIDVNIQRNFDGGTPLHLASHFNHHSAVQFLASLPATDVNKQSYNGTTPLYEAAAKGHDRIVQVLCAHPNINPNIQKNDGSTALLMASSIGKADVVKTLLSLDCLDVKMVNCCGCSPLYIASQNGHLGVVSLLAAVPNIDPNIRHSLGAGGTALYIAASKGYAEIVQRLCAIKNLDPNVPTSTGATALYMAAQNNRATVIDVLSSLDNLEVNSRIHDNGTTALCIASQRGCTDAVRALAKLRNINPNIPDSYNCTPLFLAAQNGHAGIVAVLRTIRWCNPNMFNLTGSTPLSIASERGHLSVVDQLLDFENLRPDITKYTKLDRTAIKAAAEFGHIDVVKKMMRMGDMDCQALARYLCSSCDPYFGSSAEAGNLIHGVWEQKYGLEAAEYCDIDLFKKVYQMQEDVSLEDAILLLKAAIGAEDVEKIKYVSSSWEQFAPHGENFTIFKHCWRIRSGGVPYSRVGIQSLQRNVLFNCQVATGAKQSFTEGLTDALLYATGKRCSRNILEAVADSFYSFSVTSLQGMYRELLGHGTPDTSDSSWLFSKDRYGRTVLHIAMELGIYSHVRFFVSCGLHVHLKDVFGFSPMELSTKYLDIMLNMDCSPQELSTNDVLELGLIRRGYKRQHYANTELQSKSHIEQDRHRYVEKPDPMLSIVYLESLLRKRPQPEDFLVKKSIKTLIRVFASEIAKRHPLLKFSPKLVGSSKEGTRNYFPDEYDVMCVLNQVETLCHIDTGTYSDAHHHLYVTRSDTEESKLLLANCTKGTDAALNTSMLASYFYKGFKSVLPYVRQRLHIPQLLIPATALQEKPRISCLHVIWRGDLYKDLPISIDLVPAITVPEYRVPRYRTLHLRMPGIQYYLITKATLLIHKECDMPVAFSEFEAEIVRTLPKPVKQGYKMAKMLRASGLFPPSVQADLQLKCDADLSNFLTTYMLKTSLLYLIDEEKQRGHDILQDSASPLQWADRIYGRLKEFLLEGNIPCYFSQDSFLSLLWCTDVGSERENTRKCCFKRAFLLKVVSWIQKLIEQFHSLQQTKAKRYLVYDRDGSDHCFDFYNVLSAKYKAVMVAVTEPKHVYSRQKGTHIFAYQKRERFSSARAKRIKMLFKLI